jgi:hypothetical protein
MLNGSGVEQAVAVPSRIQAAVKKQAEAAANLREVRRQLAQERTKLAALERRLAALRAAALPRRREVWCADLTETGTGAVATIEVPGEPQRMLIAPGCPPPQKSDGQVLEREILDPNQAYFNAAVLPGVQKWRPDYRLGTLSAVDYAADKATVLLDAAQSSADSLPINQDGVLENIPVVYQSCHAAAFSVGDRVLVAFHDRKWGQAYVAGFESNPRPCVKPWLVIWNNSSWSWYWQFPTPNNSDYGFSTPFDDETGDGSIYSPIHWDGSHDVVEYEKPQYAMLGLDNLGKWRTWPWLNEKMLLHGAGLRPGTHAQRVYLNGKKRLLQFNLTEQWNVHARMEQERRNSAWSYVNWEFGDQAVITLGGKPFALGPETGIFVPDHYEYGRLCGVSVFNDRFGVQWIIAVVYVKTLTTAGFYVFCRPLSGSAWNLLLKDEYLLSTAWIGRACQQWKFKVDGSQAALVANNSVRLLDVYSGPSDGAPPSVSFSWHPSYSYEPLRLDHQFWYPQSGPLLLFGSADYDARTQALRVSYADGAGWFNFMVWVDNRYGMELKWTDGRYGLFEFGRPGAEPVVWDVGGGLPYRLGFIQFDGRNGVAGFYLARGQNTGDGAGLSWRVYSFNAGGVLKAESWVNAPAHFKAMTYAWPMAVGTAEDTWR